MYSVWDVEVTETWRRFRFLEKLDSVSITLHLFTGFSMAMLNNQMVFHTNQYTSIRCILMEYFGMMEIVDNHNNIDVN